jgi:hypothetical protein
MPLQQPLPPDQGWSEINAPELVKWEKPGETIAGVLMAVTTVVLSNKKVPQFLLALGEKHLKFLGTFDLCQKLNSRYIGCQVRVKYLGEDENIRGGPNNQPMKVFSVQIKGTPSREVQGGPITDEDIPF